MKDGCRLCDYHGCDDCMFISRVYKHNKMFKGDIKFTTKRKGIVTPDHIRNPISLQNKSLK